MTGEPFRLSIQELGDVGAHWQRTIMPHDALHYIPPNSGGWGVVRMALLVPESVVLMVAPAVCGRITAIRGLQVGYRDRFYLLSIDETEMTTGGYIRKITAAAAEILDSCNPRPRVLLLCATCVDDLLGSDYDAIARELERKHGLLVRAIHLKPIAADGRRPSGIATQLAVHDLLEPSVEKDSSVNLVGCPSPIDESSEFYEVLAKAGISRVRHIAACSAFDEFREMSRARLNLLARPVARLAVQQMERKLGIPYCYAPVAYSMETIGHTYRLLSERLGVVLDTDRYREEAEDAIASYRRQLGPLTVAVGSSVNAGPFELARALTEYGFRVKYLFTNLVIDFEVEHVEWLKEKAPNLVVFADSHTSMVSFRQLGLRVDLAMGFVAGYYCSGASTVPLLADRQPYGYRGVVQLLQQMAESLDNPKSHRQLMYESFATV